jgi:chloramphenicol O-acetyltransferase type A
MPKYIDINSWIRKEHYEWFKNFDEPFWGIVSEIDCTKAYIKSKQENIPFYHIYLHKSLKAINSIEEFRYRIEGEQVICFDKINASATINNKDHLYAMSFIEYSDDLKAFSDAFKAEEKRVKSISGLGVNKDTIRKDVVHYSSVPWFKITGLTHARNYKFKDSVPKITFGKFEETGNKKIMNIAINGHHGLVDGFHAAQFLKLFQELLNN